MNLNETVTDLSAVKVDCLGTMVAVATETDIILWEVQRVMQSCCCFVLSSLIGHICTVKHWWASLSPSLHIKFLVL